ncbi:MAG: hypothetical protein H0T76_11615 [Nannocystis sp.]|nr:hypothetical protein [Nannocystis sp.]MBA3547123.1 hypothetical protein [Nannocystis sp.]
MHRPTARRIVTPFLLVLHLAGCGTDTSTTGTEADTALTTQTEDGQATAPDAPTTGTAATSTTAASTGTTSTATTDDVSTAGSSTSDGGSGAEESGAVADTSAASSTGDSSETGIEPPPPPLCADQDGPPPAVDTPKAINDDPAFIQVYVNNIENLKLSGEQCAGDWTDLIYYMKTIEPSPDLFLVQQISDTAQLDILIERMNTELPGIFEGIIADADPWTQLSPCGKEKEKQTNAIIFRQGRFSKVGEKHVWQSWANKNGECVRNNQARTRNVMIKLHDKIADKDVAVASLHWSTSQGEGPDPACAKPNVLEADQKVHKNGFGGDLVIFGGDFNESDRNENGGFRPWYALANGDDGGELNYRDPIYRTCQSAKDLQTCLDDNRTGSKRIDMLFAQDGDGCRARTRRAHTITYNEAEAAAKAITGIGDPDLNYSEHRAVRAEFYY